MDTYNIDIELEHYVGDRMGMNNREAVRRLYLRAVSRFRGQELATYLERLKSHAAVYASLCHMLQSPLRHMEAPLFMAGLVLFLAGVAMAVAGEFSAVVAAGTSAGLVSMLHCGKKLLALRQEYGVREAMFLELVEKLGEDR